MKKLTIDETVKTEDTVSEKPYPAMVRAAREITEMFTDAMGVNEVEPTARDMTDHRRDGNTPVIVLPEIPDWLATLTGAVLFALLVLICMGIVGIGIWIVG